MKKGLMKRWLLSCDLRNECSVLPGIVQVGGRHSRQAERQPEKARRREPDVFGKLAHSSVLKDGLELGRKRKHCY